VKDHRHIWATTGCYCGAGCCTSHGYTDGESITHSRVNLRNFYRFYQCDQPAIEGTYCQFHMIAERYLRSAGIISIAAIHREIETGEPAVAYTRQEFEDGR
jgi:hypothetical protein